MNVRIINIYSLRLHSSLNCRLSRILPQADAICVRKDGTVIMYVTGSGELGDQAQWGGLETFPVARCVMATHSLVSNSIRLARAIIFRICFSKHKRFNLIIRREWKVSFLGYFRAVSQIQSVTSPYQAA